MSQPLRSKDASLFRQVIRNFESKQYKKGVKIADQILKKNPKHGETLAMKALIINSQGRSEEAFVMAKEALRYDMKSHVCWHVYGLLYRAAKNFEEAIKAYKFALKLEPDSPNILRDLALLQVQMRDYQGYIVSRRAMLQSKSAQRQYWTALAVANHLAGNLKAAENILTTYEETLKNPPSKTDLEHSEAVLYKNTIIAEQGDIDRALAHLDTIAGNALDRTAMFEMRADYLLRLGKMEDAQKAYRKLLDRNPENRIYFRGLERSLGAETAEERKSMKGVYDEYAEKNPRGDAARRIPLDFLEGEEFRGAAEGYLRRMLSRGIPSTFANVKALYSDTAKRDTIHAIVQSFAEEANSSPERKKSGEIVAQTNGDTEKDRFTSSVDYFLAQHYNYHLSRDLTLARSHIRSAIAHEPKSVDFHMTLARIHKHLGDLALASSTMEQARTLDTRDRYINTKAAKYFLRANDNTSALTTMAMFTRNETAGGPLGDLHEMQCMWYLTEDGEAYVRQGQFGLALKRFKAIHDIFDVWQEDQFDFHSFSLKKGMVRAYIEMVRWEDQLREHPFYSRVALDAIEVYVKLFDHPHLAHASLSNGTGKGEDFGKMDEAERKKAIKKAKREEQKKVDAEKRKEEVEKDKKKTGPGGSAKEDDAETKKKKEDDDPNGTKLAQTEKPLEEAMKFLTPLLEFSAGLIQAQAAGFEVYLRRKKYLLALKCLLVAHKLDAFNPTLHFQTIQLKQALIHPAPTASPLPPPLLEVLNPLLATLLPSTSPTTTLQALTTTWIQSHPSSVPHTLAHLQARHHLLLHDHQSNTTATATAAATAPLEAELLKLTDLPSCTISDATQAMDILRQWGSPKENVSTFRETAARRWTEAGAFKLGDATDLN